MKSKAVSLQEFPSNGVNTAASVAESEGATALRAAEVCDYCKGIGACPRCWGRSAIAEKAVELARLRSQVDTLREALERLIRECDKSDEWIMRHGTAITNARAALSTIKEPR
jgi:hypothetical protein